MCSRFLATDPGWLRQPVAASHVVPLIEVRPRFSQMTRQPLARCGSFVTIFRGTPNADTPFFCVLLRPGFLSKGLPILADGGMTRAKSEMPLSEADLKTSAAVFNEIKNSHPSIHSWTVKDLDYKPPPDTWLAKTRKTRPRAGVDIPVTYTVRVDALNTENGKAGVFVVGYDLTAQKEIEYKAGGIVWR
jgi:hypothetical protein